MYTAELQKNPLQAKHCQCMISPCNMAALASVDNNLDESMKLPDSKYGCSADKQQTGNSLIWEYETRQPIAMINTQF